MENDNLIYGIHAILETLKEGKSIDQILIKKQSDNEQIREIIYLARKNDVTVKSVPIEKLNRITRKAHQGVIAFTSPIEFQYIEQIVPNIFEKGEIPLIVILDQVSDVRNFGAIVRSCECMGVHAIVIPQKGAAQINSDAVKTSAGALFKIPICKSKSLYNSVQFLQGSGIQIVSASEKFAQYTFDIDFKIPTAIIMGSEDEGISDNLIEISNERMKIPMVGEISSLNVSVATGICLYEVTRQRL